MSIFDEPKQLQKWYERLKGERSTTENVWQSISDSMIGRRDFTTKPFPGRERMAAILDTTALSSNQLMAGALHGMLTNPASEWIELQPQRREVMEQLDAMVWLEDSQRRMMAFLRTGQSNFVTQMAELYLDIPAFGMGCMTITEKPMKGPRFKTRSLAEAYLEQNDEGEVDVVFRSVDLTARQFAARYPKADDNQVSRALESDNPEKKFEVIQLVARSDDPYAGQSPFRKPWTSVHFRPNLSDQTAYIIEKGGFDQKPILTPRWSVEAGEVYARGPGHISLSDGRMLNEMSRTQIKAAQKSADPPLLVTNEAVLGGIRTQPGGVNIVETISGVGGAPEAIRTLPISGDFQVTVEMIRQRQQNIKNAFWSHILQLFEDPRMTATQVIELANKAQQLMAPMVGRLQTELLEPLIQRVYTIMLRQRFFLPMPMVLRNENIEIKYVSPITRAQRMTEAQAVLETWAGAAQIAEASQSPEALEALDPVESVRVIHEARAAPSRILRSRRQIREAREVREARAAEIQELQMLGEGANVAKTITEATANTMKKAA